MDENKQDDKQDEKTSLIIVHEDYTHQHRSILNLDLESTERDPIYLGVSYFYLKFLNVHKKLHLKHFDPFSVW